MKFHEFQPEAADLQNHILQYIFIEETVNEKKPYLLPPNGIPGLVIQFKETKSLLKLGEEDAIPSPRAFVVGIYKNKLTRIHLGEVGIMCILFKPTSIFHLFGISCKTFSQKVVTSINEVVNDTYDEMVKRIVEASSYEDKITIFEAFISKQFVLTNTKFNMIDDIAKEIFYNNGIIKLNDMLAKYKISRRWMEKGFAERVGVTPKYYQELLRFNHVIRLLRNSNKHDWGKIIVECGFYDHPHLIKQFRKFSNTSPKLLMEQENDLMDYLIGNY